MKYIQLYENFINSEPYRGIGIYYHQTETEEEAKSIIKNGFKTLNEVWVGKEDFMYYGDYVVVVETPLFNKPFVLESQYCEEYHITKEEVESNQKFYENLGGEKNHNLFLKIKELGYDVILDYGGEALCFLYPETLKPTNYYYVGEDEND